jgi:hypothetical protein
VRGLDVSLCGLGKNQLVERQVGDRTAQPCVLRLELLQPLDLVALQPAVLIAPPIVRNFRYPYRSYGLRDWSPLAHQHIDLPLLRDDLFRRMSFPRHCLFLVLQNYNSGRTTSMGAVILHELCPSKSNRT